MNKLCSKYQPSYAGSAHVSRRTFLGGITASTFASGVLGCGGVDRSVGHADRRRFQSPISAPSGPMAMPGPFPGRVVEVSHSGSVTAGMRHRDAVKIMMDYGMGQLVPDAETAVDAWRSFFHKGDRVAIKVVPVGKVAKPGPIRRGQGCVVDLKRPGSISSYEVVLEVIVLTNYSRKWRNKKDDENTPPVSNQNTQRLLVGSSISPEDYDQKYQHPSQ